MKYVLLLTNGLPSGGGLKIIAEKPVIGEDPDNLVKGSFFKVLPGDLDGEVGGRVIKKGENDNPRILIYPKAFIYDEAIRRKLEKIGWTFFT